MPPVVGEARKSPEFDMEWTKSLDIKGLLAEYTHMTIKLTEQARALRVPLLGRDKVSMLVWLAISLVALLLLLLLFLLLYFNLVVHYEALIFYYHTL